MAPIQLTWRPHFACSCLHAAEALASGGTIVDPKLAKVITPATADLATALSSAPVPAARIWRRLISLSTLVDGHRDLAAQTLAKTMGRGPVAELLAPRLAATLADLFHAVRQAFPNLIEELELRSRPLREQWEARGPGLLAAVGRATEESLIVESATVALVPPALGGGGEPHLNSNTVRIEAVLANPHPELPEVVRLAWMLAQLQLDLPAYCDRIQADRLPHIARFAMLAPVLLAAEQVELVRYSPQLIEQAIAAWHLRAPGDVNAAAVVLQWWETYCETRSPFPVAMTALDQMFG